MGSASKFTSVFFRIMELISASIVAGILGTYLHYINQAGVGRNGRIVYTIAIAGISIFFALVLIPPLRYSFYAFPFDFAMFVCWMVAFGLLINLAGGRGCNSTWYRTNWGWAWGRWFRVVPSSAVTSAEVGNAWCGRWRAAAAWTFIGGFFWLLSFAVGIYVLSKKRRNDRTNVTEVKRHEESHVTGDGRFHNANRDATQQPQAVPYEQDVACGQCGDYNRFGSKSCNGCGSRLAPREVV